MGCLNSTFVSIFLTRYLLTLAIQLVVFVERRKWSAAHAESIESTTRPIPIIGLRVKMVTPLYGLHVFGNGLRLSTTNCSFKINCFVLTKFQEKALIPRAYGAFRIEPMMPIQENKTIRLSQNCSKVQFQDQFYQFYYSFYGWRYLDLLLNGISTFSCFVCNLNQNWIFFKINEQDIIPNKDPHNFIILDLILDLVGC